MTNLTPEEIKSYKYNKKNGLFLGFGVDFDNMDNGVVPVYVPWGTLNGHTIVFGTTRVGKTRLMMAFVDQMIEENMDLIIVDPKGSKGQEIIGWVLEYAEKHQKLSKVKYISPMFPEHSLPLNPLYYMSNEEIASTIAGLIESKDEFYQNMGYEIVMAICLSLDYIEKTSPKTRILAEIEAEYSRFYGLDDIVDVVNMVMNPDLAQRVSEPEIMENVETAVPPLRSLLTMADLAAYSTKEGLESLKHYVTSTNEELHENPAAIHKLKVLKTQALRALEEQIKKPADYFSKVASSYNLILNKLSSGSIGAIFSTVKINPLIDLLYQEGDGNIFIVQPASMVYKQAADAFVKIYFAMMMSLFGRIGATGRGLPRQVGLCIDEGGAALYKGVEALFNKGGGLGLRIMLFTQAFSDFDAVIGKELAAIISDNTNVKIYLRMNDEASREKVASSFGVLKKEEDSISGSKRDFKTSVSRKEEEILTASHVSQLPSQHFLFHNGDRRYLVKGPYTADPKYFIEMPTLEAEDVMAMFNNENFSSKKMQKQQ